MKKHCLACEEICENGDFCPECKSGYESLAYPRSCYHEQSTTIVSHLYSDPIARLIKRAKEQSFGLWDERLKNFFAQWMDHWVPVLELLDFDIIVSVPGHAIRCELQTDLAAYAALEFSKRLKKPVVTAPLLRRKICDRDIFLLNKNPSMLERLYWRPFSFESTSAGRAGKSFDPAKKILLIDDVMSSGATLQTCKKLLQLQGNTVTASFVFAASMLANRTNFAV